MTDNREQQKLEFNSRDLYRVEVFTDQRAGSIRRMVPVDAEGNPDPDREVHYIGETQAMTPAGALPLNFELDADSLQQAAAGFGEAAEQALHETVEELKKMQREAQSSIMVPGQGGPGGGAGGPGLGGNLGDKPLKF